MLSRMVQKTRAALPYFTRTLPSAAHAHSHLPKNFSYRSTTALTPTSRPHRARTFSTTMSAPSHRTIPTHRSPSIFSSHASPFKISLSRDALRNFSSTSAALRPVADQKMLAREPLVSPPIPDQPKLDADKELIRIALRIRTSPLEKEDLIARFILTLEEGGNPCSLDPEAASSENPARALFEELLKDERYRAKLLKPFIDQHIKYCIEQKLTANDPILIAERNDPTLYYLKMAVLEQKECAEKFLMHAINSDDLKLTNTILAANIIPPNICLDDEEEVTALDLAAARVVEHQHYDIFLALLAAGNNPFHAPEKLLRPLIETSPSLGPLKKTLLTEHPPAIIFLQLLATASTDASTEKKLLEVLSTLHAKHYGDDPTPSAMKGLDPTILFLQKMLETRARDMINDIKVPPSEKRATYYKHILHLCHDAKVDLRNVISTLPSRESLLTFYQHTVTALLDREDQQELAYLTNGIRSALDSNMLPSTFAERMKLFLCESLEQELVAHSRSRNHLARAFHLFILTHTARIKPAGILQLPIAAPLFEKAFEEAVKGFSHALEDLITASLSDEIALKYMQKAFDHGLYRVCIDLMKTCQEHDMVSFFTRANKNQRELLLDYAFKTALEGHSFALHYLITSSGSEEIALKYIQKAFEHDQYDLCILLVKACEQKGMTSFLEKLDSTQREIIRINYFYAEQRKELFMQFSSIPKEQKSIHAPMEKEAQFAIAFTGTRRSALTLIDTMRSEPDLFHEIDEKSGFSLATLLAMRQEVLLPEELNVNRPDGNGNTPFTLLAHRGFYPLCADMVCNASPNLKELAHWQIKKIITLIEKRINHPKPNDSIPIQKCKAALQKIQRELNERLLKAIKNNETRDTAELLSYGADANTKTHEGTSAIQCAVEQKNPVTQDLLLLHGADPFRGNCAALLEDKHARDAMLKFLKKIPALPHPIEELEASITKPQWTHLFSECYKEVHTARLLEEGIAQQAAHDYFPPLPLLPESPSKPLPHFVPLVTQPTPPATGVTTS